MAETFARRFNEFYRQAADTDDDFVQVEEANSISEHLIGRKIDGYGESEEDASVVILDVDNVDQLFHEDPSGAAVIMPSIDPNRGLETARILIKRSGMKTTVFVVQDTCRQGFAKTLNDTAQRLNVAYLCYVAEDAFPGVDWLRIAYEKLELTGKGLLAFNDGKWNGRIAGFGMVRTQWVKALYGGPVFFPGYRSHKADNELTLIARIMNELIYDPTATLIELDPSKALEDAEDGNERKRDRSLFYERLHSAFDSRFPWHDIAPYKDEYLNLRKLRAERGELYEPTDDAIEYVNVENVKNFSWRDPEGIAVVLPCVNPEKGLAVARLLVKKAGIAAHVCVVEDTLRKGFIATLNNTAAQLDVKYIVYVAEDAFPGRNWLKTAYARMEETGKGLLAFNCGKWHGRVAAFGMVRKDWVRQVYGPGVILHPAYKAHKADNEITVIARVTQQFVYEPNSVLIENDPRKSFKENMPEDKATFHRRFRASFDGLAPLERLKPLAKSYFVPMEAEYTADAPNTGSDVPCVSNHSRVIGKLHSDFAATSRATMTSLRADVLQQEKGRTNDRELCGVLDSLRAFAVQAIERSPYSVTEKTTLPPSGDCRDYWHPAPYWWPDPKASDGLPYVRKDGYRVPGTRLYDPDSEKYDRTRLQGVFDDTLILGLAWSYFGERRYAEAGARILKRFFVDSDTAMNPHLKYAQVRIGHDSDQGAPTGLIEAKDMYFYLDAVRLIQDADVLPKEDFRIFHDWLGTYLDWILTSRQGKAECAASNNHGTCYDLQVAAIASFLGEKDIVYQTLARAQERVALQFAPDGRQPEELARNTTAHYCCFNVQSWINLAELSSRWHVNLWDYETPAGAGLKSATRWLISHMHKPWPYAQIDLFDSDRFLPIWFAASERLDIPIIFQNLPQSAYAAKPVFFPHDGIRPFWNLASYGTASEPSRQMQERSPTR